MPNCDFYALAADCAAVLGFVFEQPGWTLVELASVPDQKLRTFRSTAEVRAAYPVGKRETHFQLHAPEMKGRVIARRINVNPGAVPGATHRYDAEGWGLIQLYFGAVRDGRLSRSHTNHNSLRRAQVWEPTVGGARDRVADWDFAAVTRISSRLNRFIRRLAVAKHGSVAILPAAHLAVEERRVAL